MTMQIPDDYNLIFLKMPGDVRGCVRTDPDGYPTIFINVDLSPAGRREALDHELAHLARGDYTNHLTIWEAETGELRTARVSVMFCHHFSPLTDEEYIVWLYTGYLLMKEWEAMDALPLPERLKAHRWSKRLSRAEAADRFGVTAQDILEYETGKTIPPEDVLRAMCQAYGIAG